MSLSSNRVNGFAISPAEHLTSNVQFFTINTSVDLANTLATNAVATVALLPAALANNALAYVNGATALDKLIEIFSLRGQPVIMAPITFASATGYTLSLMSEHNGSWSLTGSFTVDNSAVDLAAALNAGGVDYGFAIPAANVVVSSSLFPAYPVFIE
jgi:hypothetical protein